MLAKLSLIVPIILLLLFLIWLPLYYFFGIDPFFIGGFIRSKLTKPTKITVVIPLGTRDTHGALASFTVNKYASLEKVTAIAFEGKLLFAASLNGSVKTFMDTDGNGVSDKETNFYEGLNKPLGILPQDNSIYVAQAGKVSLLTDSDANGRADKAVDIITDLPVGKHQTDSLAIGPDNRLYISQGSTSDRGEFGIEDLEASILRSDLQGNGLEVYASGLRNPFGLAFKPDTGELFATDNGQDFPSFGVPDELNLIKQGASYGWPNCWGNNQGTNCKPDSVKPIALLGDHVSADGIVFYNGGQLPDMFKNNLFIAEYGANSGDPSVGKRIVRAVLTKTAAGYTATIGDFATGFDHPISLAVGPEGCLYVADFGKGEIDRICATYN